MKPSICDASEERTKPCRTCGKPFTRKTPSLLKQAIFCGQACRAVADRRSLPECFWPKVDKRGPAECWPWTGSRKPRGYGHLHHHGKDYNAHRVAWEFANGPIPIGLHVLHKCDVTSCVNPKHLFLGTHDDNMADKARKGRGCIRLSEEKVRHIRATYKKGKTGTQLRKEYGISQSAIYEVIARRSWRWVI